MSMPRRQFITRISGAAGIGLIARDGLAGPSTAAAEQQAFGYGQTSANAATLDQRLVSHGSFRTFVNAAGPRDADMVLLLHGSGPGANAWSNWQFAAPVLQNGLFTVAPDLAGFGRSPAPTPYPQAVTGWMKLWVDQLLSLIDHYGREKVHLVGNSMGGAVALHLLTKRPERFGRVVLMGSVGVPTLLTPELDGIWGFFDGDPSPERMQEITRWFAYSDEVVAQFKDIGRMRFEAASVPDVRESFKAMFPAPRQRHLDGIVVPGAALRRLTHPVLLIHGRDDRIIPLQTSQYLLDALGGPVQLHVYTRCGHWTQVEFKDSFNGLVKAFLEARS